MSFNPKWIIGKRVRAVKMNSFHPRDGYAGIDYGRTMHHPVIEFEDGSEVVFQTEEHPEGDGYGVSIIYRKPAARPRGDT